jgi:hypothetical protein
MAPQGRGAAERLRLLADWIEGHVIELVAALVAARKAPVSPGASTPSAR